MSWILNCLPLKAMEKITQSSHQLVMIVNFWLEIAIFKLFFIAATVFYRLLPDIKIVKPVEGEAAFRLQKCFSQGVISVRKESGRQYAVVNDTQARYDTGSRNVFRYDDLKDSVVMTKIRDHFICKYQFCVFGGSFDEHVCVFSYHRICGGSSTRRHIPRGNFSLKRQMFLAFN